MTSYLFFGILFILGLVFMAKGVKEKKREMIVIAIFVFAVLLIVLVASLFSPETRL